jgi:hypothetical protein
MVTAVSSGYTFFTKYSERDILTQGWTLLIASFRKILALLACIATG